MTEALVGRFIRKCLLLAMPFGLLLAIYWECDVFKVIHEYETFHDAEEKEGVGLNAGYVSTTTFDKYWTKYNYNSFIFGNSRSIYYEVDDWKCYLPSGSSCFHFNASSESLYGLYKKVLYIDKKGCKLDHALLVLDRSILIQLKSMVGHLFVIAPQLEDNSTCVNFHGSFIKAFLNPRFLYAWSDYKLNGKVKDYMTEGFLLSNEHITYNQQTNEMKSVGYEREIVESNFYNAKKLKVFEHQSFPDSTSAPIIAEAQLEMLYAMERVFEKHQTEVKIIISPLYEQIQLNPKDVQVLKDIFGEYNIFDFSGVNEITSDYHNYYENSHYRPHVARNLLKMIYAISPEVSLQ